MPPSQRRPGLLTPSASYKPIRYPWALEACRQQHRIHWVPETVPLGEDVRDWAVNLTPQERGLLEQIFRFFTQSDIEVNDCYMANYARVFRPTEVRMMLAAFSSMETIHILAYAMLLETVGMADSEFSAFAEVPAMRAKVDYMQEFGVRTTDDMLRTTAMFGGATEGLSLFSMFAMLMNFPRQNKMKGMGQIIAWSVRDESLHADSIITLHNTLAEEVGGRSRAVEDDIRGIFDMQVQLEDAFIDLAFSGGGVEGMTPEEIKLYIRFIANWRLGQLRLPPLFERTAHPLPWLQVMLSGQEHANFFEARSTGYSMGATRGSWAGGDGVWDRFEQRDNTAHPRDKITSRGRDHYLTEDPD